MDSILTSTKKLAGLTNEYEYFDPDIVMYINSVFLALWQMGVGPADGFSIDDETAIWEDFIPNDPLLREAAKAYMGGKARLKFDPPSNSTLLEALKSDVAENEWRLTTAAEMRKSGDVW
jgi:hypothetical protein